MKELGNEKKASMHECMHWGRNVCHILYLLYTSELDTKVRELAIKAWTTVRMKCNNLLLVVILTEYWVHHKSYNYPKSYMHIKNLQSIVKTNLRGVLGTQ